MDASSAARKASLAQRADVTIARVEAIPLRLPLAVPAKIAGAARPEDRVRRFRVGV